MVTKRVQRMMFAAAACIPLLLGSAPLYAQTSAVQQKLAALEKSSNTVNPQVAALVLFGQHLH
ncbi:hypothetical protein P3S40_25015, partial [Enterobacter hormaechei]|nr:hypothetical protein [Enterobacter hormaechei]